jgi:predicted DNA-binding protein (MmcQ/YjbR family)
MRYADVESHCLAMPGVTKEFPFGTSPVFKVGGKMFAVISTPEGGAPRGVWFKAGATSAAILTQIDGIRPCPYLARAHWVAMEGLKPLKAKELRAYLARAHALVASGLSKKKRAELGITEPARPDAFDPFA